jgi:hypothetical protein
MVFLHNKLTRPALQRYKLGICVEFPTELMEFIAERRRETECAKEHSRLATVCLEDLTCHSYSMDAIHNA